MADWIVKGSIRRGFQVFLDLAALAAAFPMALLARFDFELPISTHWWRGLGVILPLALVLQILLGRVFGLYTGRWHYGSFEELRALVVGSIVLTAILAGFDVVVSGDTRLLPLGAVAGGGVASLILMAGGRYVWRALLEYRARKKGVGGNRVLIAGAGAAGTMIGREMRRNPAHRLNPVGFVDDDPAKRKLRPADIRVLGTTEELRRIASETAADLLLIAMPSAGPETIQRLTDLAALASLEVRILPHVLSLVKGTVELADIREVRIEDLLGRDPVETDTGAIAHYLVGRVVLVTGAGGSIGEELCRQVQSLNPQRLVLLDHDESNLHALELSLRDQAVLNSPAVVVADIRDRERMRQVFRQWKPSVVFHAAAHKHLPLLELHPSEGIKTNVTGSLNVSEAAIEYGTERFIFISTDKAAQPTSVLGATKRVGELVVQQLGLDSPTCFAAVRFGNVLGSRGSVVSVFGRQIASGGPITVTDPEVTRYFMTIQEACQLVIHAGALARGGEVFVLDMGLPVKIVELARKMAQLARPDREIPIRFIGLRPGEKVHEDLFFPDEERRPCEHPKIFMESAPRHRDQVFWEKVEAVVGAAERNDDDEVRRLLARLVKGYSPVEEPEMVLGELYPDGF